MIIDKSRFSPQELAQYEALIARAKVPDNGIIETPTYSGQTDIASDAEQTQSPIPELSSALERLKRLERLIERKELAAIARKYALLGENEEELIAILSRLKQTDEASYNTYLSTLDKSLNLVQKSGLFSEIGKNNRMAVSGSIADKIQAEAAELQRVDPKLSRADAVARAWENHPEWIAEYDAQYSAH